MLVFIQRAFYFFFFPESLTLDFLTQTGLIFLARIASLDNFLNVNLYSSRIF